eukprot:578456-Amphidinium_carterae.1
MIAARRMKNLRWTQARTSRRVSRGPPLNVGRPTFRPLCDGSGLCSVAMSLTQHCVAEDSGCMWHSRPT